MKFKLLYNHIQYTEDKGICIFNGFDDKNGLSYFSCILSKILKKSQKDIMEKLEEMYDNYKKYSYIDELFKKKKEKMNKVKLKKMNLLQKIK